MPISLSMDFNMGTVWVSVGILAVFLELFILDFTFLMIAAVAGVTAITAFAGASVTVQLIVFSVSSVLALTVLRPLAKRYLPAPKYSRTNVESLVGEQAKVLEDVTIDGGLVKIGGENWTARLDRETSEEPISVGTEVKVVRIDGATAIVKTLKN